MQGRLLRRPASRVWRLTARHRAEDGGQGFVNNSDDFTREVEQGRKYMAATAIDILEDDLSGELTRELLRLHLAGMDANSPAGHVFALDLSGLKAPNVTVWTAWSDGRIAGIAALKELGDGTAEVKSMRTHPSFLRQGVGAALLEHIISVARSRGLSRLSLETGSGAAFQPAIALYRKRGFLEGEAFAGHVRSEFNQFLHLTF